MARVITCFFALILLFAAACYDRNADSHYYNQYLLCCDSLYDYEDADGSRSEEAAAIEAMTVRRKQALRNSLTDDERAFLDSLVSAGGFVRAGIVNDAYPASFYNKVEREYQGIAPDIMSEVMLLTGIRFEVPAKAHNSTIANLLRLLKNSEVSMVTQVLYSESRVDDFIWSAVPYLSSKYALLSKQDFPKLDNYRVRYHRVGVIERSIHAEKFDQWFPGHKYRIAYPTGDAAFNALERGDVCMVMVSASMLLAITNFREKTGYKINVSFDDYQESQFGYTKSEERLRDIIDKAIAHIDVEGIKDNWMTRTFDYSRKIAQQRMMYAIVIAAVAFAAMLILVFILRKNRTLSRKLMAESEKHKAAETRAIEASNIKSRFLANMSHEIRTPLNAIIGLSDLLAMEQLSSRQQNYVKDIDLASHSLLSIINDILDISKIEAGKIELHPIDYDFMELIANIVSMFRFMAHKKGLEFEYDEDRNGLPQCIYGDDVKLRQVLINLCANAVNFTSEGYVRLKVSCAGGNLLFEVSDTGPGIRPEDIKDLFSPFARAEQSKRRDVSGAGLGLPISKAFVDMMGGKIEVKSEYGKGSTFLADIPMVAGDENKVKSANNGKSRTAFKAPEAKVLVVDDNDLNLKVAFRLLSQYDISADMVASGAAAIEAVQQIDYDIIFMDHMMPEMDGVEATTKIRQLGEKYDKLPIIALTANATRGAREAFLGAGMTDYVSKPIELDKLREVLAKWLPDERIESVASPTEKTASASSGNSGGLWGTVAKISGINVEIVKNRVAGLEEMYVEMLELFCDNFDRDCRRLEEFLNNGDIENFAIAIHGMKSSLSTIGAMALSERALELETASKKGDRQPCLQKLPALLADIRDLGARITQNSNFEGENPADRPKGDPVILEKGAKAALAATENYDGDKCLEVVGKLLQYDFGAETNETLKKTKSAVKNFDFEETAGLLRRLVQG